MASVYLRGKRWSIRYRDEQGRWSAKPCAARTKREAQEKAAELATETARVRRTTDPPALLHRDVPLRELLQWWIEHYVLKTPSGPKVAGTIRKHLVERI